MSTDGALSRTRWLPRLIGVLLLLMGLALLAGGIKLSQLGGSLYYLIAGIGFALSGVLLLALRRNALGLYGLVLLGSTLWALWEVGLDWWQLVPRLALWFALGVVLLLPWARRPLAGNPSKVNTGLLSLAVVLSGATAVASQFTNPGEIQGELGRDTTEFASNAPQMPDGEWQAYGRTEYGDRYSPLRQITPNNVHKLEEAWRIRTGDLPTDNDPVELTNQNTPPSIQGSLVYPGNVGVFNWGSVSVDPVRQLLFTSPNYMAFVSKMVPREQVAAGSKRESETSGVQPNTGAPYAVIMHPFMSPLGVPCQAPAWGYVAGIDLTTNQVVWKHKNGTSRDSSPIPIGLPIGVPSMGGSIVTAGGLGFLSGTLDQYLRAYDTNTGKELWKARLPAGGQATPMTYTGKDGKQYVLVTAGGHGSLGTKMGDYVIAYKLSE